MTAFCSSPSPSRFPAYLRGIETRRLWRHYRDLAGFPAYLRGIETFVLLREASSGEAIPAYLRGIATVPGVR